MADRATPDASKLVLPTAEHVIANRSGDVLIKATVLKADHFPSESSLMNEAYL